ncbi:hypothetical protein RFI_40312, partial [Reticulomyxa filosa]
LRNRIDIIQRIHERFWPIEYKFLPALVKSYYSSTHQSTGTGSSGKTQDEDSKIEANANENKQAESANEEGWECSSASSTSIKGVGVLTQDEKQKLTLLLQTIESLLNDGMSEYLNLKCMKINILILMQDYEQALSITTNIMQFHPEHTTLINFFFLKKRIKPFFKK